MEQPTIAILAGGLATRMGAATQHTPKSLLEVAGRPFLAWQLELLAEQGLRDVVLCVGHYGDQIRSAVADHTPSGMSVRFSDEGETRRGTGGALRHALPLLSDPFVVIYGDSYLLADYCAIYRHFEQAAAPVEGARSLGLMTVFRNERLYDTSNIEFRDGRILRYDKQSQDAAMRHIDWGLGVLRHEALGNAAQRAAFDLAEVYQALLAQGRLAAYEVHERFYEIGSPAGLAELRKLLAGGTGHA